MEADDALLHSGTSCCFYNGLGLFECVIYRSVLVI